MNGRLSKDSYKMTHMELLSQTELLKPATQIAALQLRFSKSLRQNLVRMLNPGMHVHMINFSN